MPRPRIQFGLRLAVLLMTLVCVLASWFSWKQKKAKLDEQWDREREVAILRMLLDDMGGQKEGLLEHEPGKP